MNSEIVAFKEQLKDKGTKGLVIDLDETLSNTIHYWALELAKSFGNPQNLSTEEIIKRIYAQDVPFWKLEELQKWMILALKSEEMTEAHTRSLKVPIKRSLLPESLCRTAILLAISSKTLPE